MQKFKGKCPSKQAERIINKFGGVIALREALAFVGHRISRQSIYKWSYPRHWGPQGQNRDGGDGFVPEHIRPTIRLAAKELLIDLNADDWRHL